MIKVNCFLNKKVQKNFFLISVGTPEVRGLWEPRRELRTMEIASPLRANAVLCTLTHTLLRLSPSSL